MAERPRALPTVGPFLQPLWVFFPSFFPGPVQCLTTASADVRVRYQNRNMPLPACAAEGKHLPGAPEFCTLAAFRERVLELTPVDWDAECAPGPAGRAS